MSDPPEQSPKSKVQDPKSENSPVLADESEGLKSGRNAAEIAGATIEPVGEATGRFPRPPIAKSENTGKSAFLVAAGILISRILGVIRQRVFAHYLGISDAAGAFDAAFRIPNFLQNVFGEGALSASFIPVYAKLLAKGDDREATRVANAVLTLLALITSVIVLIGIFTAPYWIIVFTKSFDEGTRELTIRLVRILFPGAGLLVFSAWCLGVLNSHRRFFLSYTAPVAWNLAIIGTLIWFGGSAEQFRLTEITAWGSVVGSALQFGVQLPTVLKLIKSFRPVLDLASESVRTVLRNFFPVFISRGVVQISAFVDAILAGLISEQAVASLTYAQSLYTLPISLFGMSVSAAELPAMSSALGTSDEVASELRIRLNNGLRRIALFIVPSVVAILTLGDVMVAVLYQTGQFGSEATRYVWAILAGSTIGLLASTLGRLYSSTYYALHDTRTPLRFAILRVTLGMALGYVVAIHVPPLLGIDPKWGAAGLTTSSGLVGWIEFVLLRRTLNKRIGRTGLSAAYMVKLWVAATGGAALAWGLKLLIGTRHPAIVASLVLVPYGLTYFALAWLWRVPEAAAVINRGLRTLRLKT
ncbi:MAG TPA: murein biosynthesis integral membrane protein MurJ [Pyrinomonadaceae bacterium]|nr:murein biosynthesis integral membrane protein MurJ [Pyrinomonadaceae bacterium]